MDKTKKRAFTIVELVIVIAVIAILAAVLIALFMNLIKKANKSADMQLIRNLNTALTTDAILNGKHTTMQSALDAAEKNGYILEKINATATQSEIIWDSKNDMFCYLNDDGTIEYLPEANIKYARNTEDSTTYISDKVNDIDYFVISSTISDKYSTYLYNYTGASTLEITKGLDVGKVTTITSVKYETEATQSVIIRSNGGTLTINAQNSTVYHYGFAEVIDVNNVDNSACYHEGGRVGRLIYNDSDGKIFFESSAVVYCYMNTTSDTSANASDTTKAAGAIVYTYVDGGTNQAKGYVTENKEQVTVTNGLVEVSSCKNHNEDYDVVYIGNDVYLVCKCCGAFSKISSGASGTTTVTNSEGVNEGNNNTFSAENVEEIQDMIKDAVATIGYSKYYSTLPAAFADAVNGDTITMLKDVESTGFIQILDLKVALDLNGHTITSRVNGTSVFIPNNANAEFTLEDSIGTGAIYDYGTVSNALNAAIRVNNGKFIMNGGTIQTFGASKNNPKNPVYVGTNKTCVINGGQLSGKYISIVSAGNLTINGGTIYGENQGVQNQSNLIINNGNVSSANTAIKNTKNVTINGGNIAGTYYGIANSGTLSVTDGTIKADSYYGISNSGTLTMDGGTIIGGTHESYGRGIYNNNTGTTTINGGTISMNAQTANQQVAIDNRKTLTMNGGNVISNVIGVYSTVTFTMESGTITGGTQAVQTFGTTTINGGEIRCDNGTGINVAGGNLTLANGNIYSGVWGIYGQNTSAITINGENVRVEAIKCVYLNSATCSCNISAGTFIGGSGEVCYAQNGFFTISGGTFTGSGSTNVEDHIYRYTLNCLDSSFSADPATAGFTVTGGSFYQFNPEDDLSEGENTCFTPEGYHTEYNESTGYYTVVANN